MLLLCERTDLPALWAYRGLRERGLEPNLVTSDILVRALGWEHRLGEAGPTIRIELADGRRLDGARVGGVLNRLVVLPTYAFATAAPADREYAAAEFQALFVSWLSSLPGPLLNRPTAQGLSGPWLNESEWLVLAARAGLRTPPYRRSSVTPTAVALAASWRTVLVVAGRTRSPAPPSVADGCTRLARLVDTGVLGVDFAPGWVFAGATSHPDLQRGGDAALDLLADALSA
jgi:hypothetical protein